MKILILCNRVPFPPTDGGAIAIYDVVSNLSAAGHEVTVLAINTPKHFQPDHVLTGIARLETVYVDTSISVVKAFLNLFKPVPYVFERFISEQYQAKLISLIHQTRFDIVQIENSQMAYYVDTVRQHTQAPVILRSHNVEYLIWARLVQNETNLLKKIYLHHLVRVMKRFEQKYSEKFDAIAAITEIDQRRMQESGCRTPISFIPAGVELSRFERNNSHKPKPKTLFILSALNWLPNLEGIDWFLENIWPVVSKELPELELHIAGKDPSEKLLNLQLNNVIMHGFVPSAIEFMQTYALMLVPLLSGSGMRIKIIEGMAAGKGILSTRVGAEGIICENGANILISDDPADWINLIRDYYNGKLDIDKIGKAAEIHCKSIYDNKVIIQKFIRLYQDLIK